MNPIAKTICIFLLLCCSGCMYAIRYDGDYRGKVIDNAGHAPIEGAVVLGVWYKSTPTMAGAVSRYYDARETLTDRNGDFFIPGMGLRVMTNLDPMYILVFKAGYRQEGLGTWNALLKWEDRQNTKMIVKLRRITIADRMLQNAGGVSVPAEKRLLLRKELNKEMIELGLPPYLEGY
jgi:hypothetical protein